MTPTPSNPVSAEESKIRPAEDPHFDDDYDDEPEAMDDCGLTSEGYCMLAGSEWCDFECPFNR
jgi:hypothetical protein